MSPNRSYVKKIAHPQPYLKEKSRSERGFRMTNVRVGERHFFTSLRIPVECIIRVHAILVSKSHM